MNDAKTKLRRARFEHYFDVVLKQNRKEFCRITGYSKSWLSQLLNPDQPFNETASGNVAKRLGLPSDYFENDAPEGVIAQLPADTPEARRLKDEMEEIYKFWKPLFDHQKGPLFDQLRKAHEQAIKTLEELRQRGYKRNPGSGLPL